MADLFARAEKAQRDPKTLSVSVYGAGPDPQSLESYAEIGVDRTIFALPSVGRDAALPLLDQYAEAMTKLERK
jgi:hypothetical protein